MRFILRLFFIIGLVASVSFYFWELPEAVPVPFMERMKHGEHIGRTDVERVALPLAEIPTNAFCSQERRGFTSERTPTILCHWTELIGPTQIAWHRTTVTVEAPIKWYLNWQYQPDSYQLVPSRNFDGNGTFGLLALICLIGALCTIKSRDEEEDENGACA